MHATAVKLALVLTAVALVLAGRGWVAEPLRIPSDSMAPTLRPGDHVLVDKTAYRRGDPRPGELAVVVVDGRRPSEPYVDHGAVDSVFFGPVRVPRQSVFVLGDNRADSVDSRSFGSLGKEELVGRVATRLWPLAR